MIREFKIVRVDCDCCGAFYPSTKDPIHFQDKVSANNTIFEAGWKIVTAKDCQAHYCPSCVKVGKDSNIVIPQDEN